MLRYRPAALVCLAITVGIAVGLYFDFWVPIILMSLMWSVTMLIRPVRRFRALLITSVLVFGAGSLYGGIYEHLNSNAVTDDITYSFEAIVTEARPTVHGYRATLEVTKSDDGLKGKSVYIYADEPLEAGDGVCVDAHLKEAVRSAKGNGIDYNAFGAVNKSEKRQLKGFKYELLEIRKCISDFIYDNFSNESAAFYNAIITGDRSGINDNLNGSFSRSGLSHILAISGQHFSILVYSIYTFLMLTIQRKKLASGICIVLSIFYTALVGATPPILRASIMCCAVFAANMASVRIDSVTALCGALAGIVVFSPYASASVGLQLSFLATLGILTLSEITKRRGNGYIKSKLISLIVTPTLITFAANLFCLPVLLCSFDYVSVIAPFTNLAVNLFVAPSLAVSVLSLPIFLFAPKLKELVFVNDFIFDIIKSISDYAASLSFATFSAYLPFIKLIVIPATAAIILALTIERKHIFKVGALCLTIIIILVSLCVTWHSKSLNNNNLIYAHDDAYNAFVLYNNGESAILIDGYGNGKFSGTLLEHCVTHLDGYVITNGTKDTLKRLTQTLSYISIDKVYIPDRYKGGSLETDVAKTGCDVLYYDNELCFPNFKLREKQGDYALQVKNNDIIITILSGNKVGFSAPCKALIVTERCIYNELPPQLIPNNYKHLFIFDTSDTYFTSSIKRGAKSVTEYKTKIELRFGKNGLREVKE